MRETTGEGQAHEFSDASVIPKFPSIIAAGSTSYEVLNAAPAEQEGARRHLLADDAALGQS